MYIVICGSHRCDLLLFLLVILYDRLFLAMVDMIIHARWSQDEFMIVILWSCFHGRIMTCLYEPIFAIGEDSDRKSTEHTKINLSCNWKGLMWLIQCDLHGQNSRLDLLSPCDPAPLTGERNCRKGPWYVDRAIALLVRVAPLFTRILTLYLVLLVRTIR